MSERLFRVLSHHVSHHVVLAILYVQVQSTFVLYTANHPCRQRAIIVISKINVTFICVVVVGTGGGGGGGGGGRMSNFSSYLSQGEAMVAYDDPPAAKAAIEWFNGTYVGLGMW